MSRSTAAAMILAAQWMPGTEQRAITVVRAVRPNAQPNRMLVAFADRLLGADGRLVGSL